jgi:hypothetical protein
MCQFRSLEASRVSSGDEIDFRPASWAAIPTKNPLANGEFATIRERLIKIGARVIQYIGRCCRLPARWPREEIADIEQTYVGPSQAQPHNAIQTRQQIGR